jgi:hypothetical protein
MELCARGPQRWRMTRITFLTAAALIALSVGAFAALFPETLLTMKGVEIGAAVIVWVRQGGVALVGLGLVAIAVRKQPDSPALRAFMGNAAHQGMLAPIEVIAYAEGTITRLEGIVPNTIVHLLLALGFVWFGVRMKA